MDRSDLQKSTAYQDSGQLVGLVPEPPEQLRSLIVTFGFRCNLKCAFCMVEDVLNVYQGTTLGEFRDLIAGGKIHGYRRVTFSGGEATLESDLLEYVRLARTVDSVERVRIQTNGTRLGKRDYLQSLVDAGVDEFFVSIHGHDGPSCDRITRRRRSFEAILAGIEAVAGVAGPDLYTNTVICNANFRHLHDIVERIAPFQPAGMEFWNLWQRIDPGDTREMSIQVGESAAFVARALERCADLGIPPVVKWFPRCLLGPAGRFLDNSQPNVLIEPEFWDKAPEYSCIFDGVCQDASESCDGLSHAYVRKFGWEESLLEPRLVPLVETPEF